MSLAPADAAFFSTNVNMGDAWLDFVNGRFVGQLRSLPYVQGIERELRDQWETDGAQVAQAKAMLQNPNIQALLRLGQDMMSQECFVYGDAQWSRTLVSIVMFQNEMMSILPEGPEAMELYLDSLTPEDVADLRIPTTVLGFRIEDAENAGLQLDALEAIVRFGGSQAEQLVPILQRLKRTDLEQGHTLALTLDWSLVPTENLDPGAAKIVGTLKELFGDRRLALGLGVKDNLLLMVIGEDGDAINLVGDAENNLLSQDCMSVLRDGDTNQLRSIGYASGEWVESQWKANLENYFQRITQQMVTAIGSEMNEEDREKLGDWQAAVEADAQWLDQKLSEIAVGFGPVVSWSHRIENGLEGYSYSWTDSTMFENAAPMQVIEHAGQSPLLLFAFRQLENPYGAEMMEFMLEKAPEHVKGLVSLAERDAEDREKALKAFDAGWPLVREAYEIFRDQIIPAMGTETLFAMDMGWELSALPMPDAPIPPSPLPVPEFAFACEVKDKEQFLQGGAALYDLFDRAVDVMREIDPDSAPADYRVPRPNRTESNTGDRFTYPQLTDAMPIPGFEPQVTLTDKVLVAGYSQRQVDDMLKDQELMVRPGWMKDSTPTAAFSYIDFAGMVKSIAPWIEFGLSQSGTPLDQPVAPGNGPIPTGNDVLDIWDCFATGGQAVATMTVAEDGPDVTRWIWVYKD